MTYTQLIVLALLVIVPLAAYAAYLLWQLRRQSSTHARPPQRSDVNSELQSREQICLMLNIMLQGQVSLTEAAIRIVAMKQGLPEPQGRAEAFIPFEELTQATAHIPILEDWRALDRQQQLDFDIERQQLEQQFQERLLSAGKTLLSQLG